MISMILYSHEPELEISTSDAAVPFITSMPCLALFSSASRCQLPARVVNIWYLWLAEI